MPKKKDAWIIAGVLVLAVALFAISRFMPKKDLSERVAQETLAPDAVEYLTPEPAQQEPEETELPTVQPEETESSQPQETAQVAGPMPPAQTAEVKGHVIITVAGRQYGDPIAMDRDKVITIRQDDGKVNKVHITPEKVYMESSTCDNQDCVGQGEVSLENYETRILSTYVICLPNEVTIEMVPVE